MNYAFETVQSQRAITSISVRLYDDTGRKLPLRSGGRTALTLHFAVYGAGEFTPYKGLLYQRGSGFCENLARYAIPLFKRAAPYSKNTAVSAVKRIARNISEGDSVARAIKRGAKDTGKEILKGFAGNGIAHKRKWTGDVFSHK